MGFNAAWFARASLFVLLALAVGFLGSLYVGAKFLEPLSGTAKRDLRSAGPRQQSPAPNVVNDAAETRAAPPVTADQKAPAVPAVPTRDVARPQDADRALPQAGREKPAANAREELRLGQQERRRLRAERRRALDNARAERRPGRRPREEFRNEPPFFPFR